MVATEDVTKTKGRGMGFAGIALILSEMDTTLPPAAQAGAPMLQSTQQKPNIPSQRPAASSSSGKWWIGVAAGIGMLWLLSQFNKNTSSPTPAILPTVRSTSASYSMPTSQPQVPSQPDTNRDSELMSNGNGATYRVPSFREAELGAARLAAESAKAEAQVMNSKVDTKKLWIDAEKRQIDQAQSRLDVLEREIEQQRLLLDSSNQYEVDSFNSKVREYDTNRTQLRQRISDFNVDVGSYNFLVQQAQAKEQLANQLVNAYNSKLEQFGTRQ